jgi:hypothetical protein
MAAARAAALIGNARSLAPALGGTFGNSTVTVTSPILIEYSEAIGQVGTEKVRAPVVEAVSLIMIARGADR